MNLTMEDVKEILNITLKIPKDKMEVIDKSKQTEENTEETLSNEDREIFKRIEYAVYHNEYIIVFTNPINIINYGDLPLCISGVNSLKEYKNNEKSFVSEITYFFCTDANTGKYELLKVVVRFFPIKTAKIF